MEGSVPANLWKEAFRLSRLLPSPPSVAWAGGEWQGAVRAVLTVRVSCRHQLEAPGHYSHLAAFYEDKKGCSTPVGERQRPAPVLLAAFHPPIHVPEMKVGQPKSHAVPGLVWGRQFLIVVFMDKEICVLG